MKPEQRVPISLYVIRKTAHDALSLFASPVAIARAARLLADSMREERLRIREWCEEPTSDQMKPERAPISLSGIWSTAYNAVYYRNPGLAYCLLCRETVRAEFLRIREWRIREWCEEDYNTIKLLGERRQGKGNYYSGRISGAWTTTQIPTPRC
jgi:hypothetical protein